MVDILVDAETLSFVAAMVGIFIAVAVGLVQFRNFVKARQIEIYLDLYNKIMEKDLHRWSVEVAVLWKWKDPSNFFEKYGPENNMDEFLKFTAVTTYLENMGLVLKEKLVSARMVANLVGTTILGFWEKYKPVIREFQRRYKLPKVMPMTEYLYQEVKMVRPE
nr:hypothetical protein [Candidatus Njordarchaeum guaymaensis]